MKRLGVLISVLLLAAASLGAQNLDAVALRAGVEAGNNSVGGDFARYSVGAQSFYGCWTTSLGASFSTARIGVADVEQRYLLRGYPFAFGARMLLRDLRPYRATDFAAALYAEYSARYCRLQLGYARRFADLREPLNLYYSVEFVAPLSVPLSVRLKAASYDDFIIERAQSPFLSLACAYQVNGGVTLSASAVSHRAGMFNLAAQRYEAYLKLGVQWVW